MSRDRRATLVVVDGAGALRGALVDVRLPMPWWQETAPILDVVPGAAVVRLLDARPDPGEPMGGEVTYLVSSEAELDLVPWTGELAPHPLRMPWAEAGGPEADLAWVADQVEITGPPRQHRTWNLSAIWSIPTPGGVVWLKCVPWFFAHEAAVLDVIADQPVPRLLAAEGHRLLLAPMAGDDGHEATPAQHRAMLAALVELQLATGDRVPTLLARGVPDLRSGPLVAELADLVARVAPGRRLLARLVDELPDRLAALTACGLPDTIVHGDVHGGNCRVGVEPPLWFDWGDSYVGHPLLDGAGPERMSDRAVGDWLGIWQERTGLDLGEVWAVAEPVAQLRTAWVYQRFLDNIEPAERAYHGDDVPLALANVTALLERSS